jgi:DNA polymerase-3 subunit delta
MQRQASRWSRDALERALSLLLDTDLTLRSSADVPALALVERALLRIAWMSRR